MKNLLYFAIFMALALMAIVIGVIIGDYASWSFAWIAGTAMIVLVSAASGAFFDAQEKDCRNGGEISGKAVH